MSKKVWIAGAILGVVCAWQFADAASPATTPSLITTTDGQLRGKEEGDVVKVTSPGGSKELEIRKLTTIHDAVK